MSTSRPKNYAFDFDGVIAQYDGYRGSDHAGEPILEVVEAIRTLKSHGHTIIVYAATRENDFLRAYAEKHNIPIDHYNENPQIATGRTHKPVAHVYIDDRAVTYRGQNAADLVEEIETFEVYWKQSK